jgi:hypothetical protein
MISQNFLYYSLGVGFLILVGFLSWAAFSLSKTLKRLTSILEKADDLAKDADDLKNYAKSGIMYLVNLVIGKRPPARRAYGPDGGDKHGKQK